MKNSEKYTPTFLVKALTVIVDIVLVLTILSLISYIFLIPTRFMMGIGGGMHFKHGVPLLYGLTLVVSILSSAFFLWIIWHLRLILKSLKTGTPFAKENPKRIRKVAYGVLAWGPIRLTSFFLGNKLIITGIGLYTNALLHSFSIIFIEFRFVAGVFVIAQIFERGIVLQQDHDLTV